MTATQRDKLINDIMNLAGEHCRSFIFYAEVETDECGVKEYGEGMDTHQVCSCYEGGIVAAIGLAQIAKLSLTEEFLNQGDEVEERE